MRSLRHVSVLLASGFAVCAAGCEEFELPSIVLDLRVLAIQLEPPEVVIPFDPDDLPQDPGDIGDIEVPPVQVCALVGDPRDSRSLDFFMSVCRPTPTLRCGPEFVDEGDEPPITFEIGDGTVDDPEEAASPVSMCGTVPADLRLYNILEEAIENDSLSGFGGVEIQVDFAVYPTGGDFATAEWAGKRILYAPQIPPERVANQNPMLDELAVTRPDSGDDGAETAELGRCADVVAPLTARPGEELNFEPIETEGSREDYVVPTFEGSSRMFTENHTYRWYATTGKWSAQGTGGPKDVAGNDPVLDTDWTAPEDLTAPEDVEIWVVQRDERGGLRWYQTCVRVAP